MVAEGLDFLGYVDAHGAPSDATATAHASRGAELINPGGQFVSEPHAIAIFGGGPEILSMNVAMVRGEAGVPHPGMFGLLEV